MNFLERLTKKTAKTAAKTASVEVKKEIKKTAIDLLPGVLTFVGAIASILIFRNGGDGGRVMSVDSRKRTPSYSRTHITTNNYFLGDVSDDVIKKILEEK